MFDESDYKRGAEYLGTDPVYLKAVAAIESAGENFWNVNGKKVPPIRPEAHWFGRLTNYQFNDTHPHISSRSWDPSLAATTREEAWKQYEEMKSLDPKAAAEATSWGPFQIMGFHWRRMGYPSVEAFIDDMDGPDDDGQMNTFVEFVKRDLSLLRAIRSGDWDTWEKAYNGGGYGGAYAAKIRAWLRNYGREAKAPRILKLGDSGEDVRSVQLALGVDADGQFGPKTKAAVEAFQHDRGLTVDGIVGRFTKEALAIN